MLKISKYVLPSTSLNVQSICQASTKRSNTTSKFNKMKKLMKEYKSIFGTLLETNSQKKRRLKLEKKGKIPRQRPNMTNTELSWIMENSGSNLKRITLSTDSQNKQKEAGQYIPESTSYFHQIKKTDVNSSSEQNHLNNFINPNKNQTNLKRSWKKFNKVILKIKSASDQNIENISHAGSNYVNEVRSEMINPMCDLSEITKKNNLNEDLPTIGHLHDKSKSAENSNFDDKSLINPNSSDTKSIITEHGSSTFGKLSDIIIKNMLSFPIMGSKRESSTNSTEILSISGKDDFDTIKFPGITKILTQTMPLESKLALEAWKKRMIAKLGQEGFEIHQKALLEDGASLHSCIAQYLLGKEYEVPRKIEPVFNSMRNILENVHHVKAVETHVAHPKLCYKGIIDCVASYRDENYVIDWKKSDRKKLNLKETYDAPLQIAAYIGAINASNLYSFTIKRGLLVIAYTCGAPATVYEVCDNTLQQYWVAWLQRLQRYYVETANSDDNKSIQQ